MTKSRRHKVINALHCTSFVLDFIWLFILMNFDLGVLISQTISCSDCLHDLSNDIEKSSIIQKEWLHEVVRGVWHDVKVGSDWGIGTCGKKCITKLKGNWHDIHYQYILCFPMLASLDLHRLWDIFSCISWHFLALMNRDIPYLRWSLRQYVLCNKFVFIRPIKTMAALLPPFYKKGLSLKKDFLLCTLSWGLISHMYP